MEGESICWNVQQRSILRKSLHFWAGVLKHILHTGTSASVYSGTAFALCQILFYGISFGLCFSLVERWKIWFVPASLCDSAGFLVPVKHGLDELLLHIPVWTRKIFEVSTWWIKEISGACWFKPGQVLVFLQGIIIGEILNGTVLIRVGSSASALLIKTQTAARKWSSNDRASI